MFKLEPKRDQTQRKIDHKQFLNLSTLPQQVISAVKETVIY